MRRLVTALLLSLAACGGLVALPSAASAACAGADVPVADAAAAEGTMLCLVNQYRVANGRTALVADARLNQAARAHAQDMVARHYFAHDTPEGLDPSDRARAVGFPTGAGENIAWATDVTPQSMFEQWRTSPGHNENMLYTGYNVVGTGFALGNPAGERWGNRGATGVQDFGRLATVPADGETGLGGDAPATSPSGAPTTTPPVTRPAPACRPDPAVAAARRRLAAARHRAARAHSRRTRARAARRVRAARAALELAQMRARATARNAACH